MDSPSSSSSEPLFPSIDRLDAITVASPNTFPINITLPENRFAGGTVSITASCLSVANLHEIGRRFSFPPSAVLAVPRDSYRACFPPLGFVNIYEDSLISGLRVPIPSIYADIYEKYDISSAQFYPNGFLQITGLGVACQRLFLPFTVDYFSIMFHFKAGKGVWYFVIPRQLFRV